MTVSSVGSSSLTQQLQQLQQSLFKTADADSDGSLSLSEFQSIGQNVQGGGKSSTASALTGSSNGAANFSGDTLRSLMSVQMLGSDSGSILSSSDSNSDGLLSADEIASALSANAPEGAKGLGLEDKMASDMISALDTDSDGSLSSDEIASGLSAAQTVQSAMQGMRGPPPGPPPSGGEGGASSSASATGSSGVFEALDTNQDGTVSASELAAADTDSTDAASAAADLISASDSDGDGALSGSEFADMLDAAKTSSTSTDSASTLSSVLSSSTLASDLMSKLLAQLDSALASKSSSGSTVSATA